MKSNAEHNLLTYGWAIATAKELDYLLSKYELRVYEKYNGNYIVKLKVSQRNNRGLYAKGL